MESKYYYSLIQFSPDRFKHEAANIGVAIYAPLEKRVFVRVSNDNKRIKRFFGPQDWQFVSIARRGIERRLKSASFGSQVEFENFIARRANSIRMTHPQPIAGSDAASELDVLYSELVEETSISRRTRIDREFRDVLVGAGIRQLVKGRVTVQLPSLGGVLQAPYGYRNGRFNLLEPVQFGNEGKNLLEAIGGKALEGSYLFDHPDPVHGELCLNVVGQFSEQTPNEARLFAKGVFEKNHVKFYAWDNLDPLFEEIRDAVSQHNAERE